MQSHKSIGLNRDFHGPARCAPLSPCLSCHIKRRSYCLQPVYVEDVAEAVTRVLADPGTVSRIYELAGPEV
jgi:hypothetical protein